MITIRSTKADFVRKSRVFSKARSGLQGTTIVRGFIIKKVKLPARRAGLPGKEVYFILCPLTPPIRLWRDRARSGQKDFEPSITICIVQYA
jgi:hypothetical protein